MLYVCRGPGDGDLIETTLRVELAEGGDDERLGRPLRLHVGPVRRHRFRVRQRANLNNNKNLTNQPQGVIKAVFILYGSGSQHFSLNTEPDPGFC